ncbi:hypothetical protein H312_03126 [Anncaliia algerae PRA339]|uniref:LSM domain-containing protein n=1 Tax=Anncaliia algerae PRA339 TaxID=1288291 RepID=A0A059EX49_9MICR|nr:hypothetical protein H312_03126 [Anncaliia algerae PRA339]
MEKRLVPPLEMIVKFINDKKDVDVVLKKSELRCRIIGVDEYMNLVVDHGLNRMLIKGSAIYMIKEIV